MRIISIILFFFLLGAFFIISEKNLYLTNNQDQITFKNDYTFWITHLSTAVTKSYVTLVGNVVKLEWLPKDEILGNVTATKKS
ncbi:hypothetical protein COU61_02330 [Candidatus Pacearchaeota archaeon CG10_big_fil_rev_8_21_14_0_10_35_13]|nr:MAG: hypothetical protein COU61_02330 [Candidatus Pacearchaeota archaeon CG10_big_fil_rev_8_21_14_0_10_35_13]